MPPLPEHGVRTAFLAVSYAGLYGLTIVAGVTGSVLAMNAAIVFGALFVALVAPAVGRRNGIVGVVLVLMGTAMAATSGHAGAAILEGTAKTLPLLVLFGAALTLRHPAQNSPSMIAIGTWIGLQPRSRRFLVVAMSTHLFAWVLNQAAIPLMVGFLRDPPGSSDHRRLMMAIMRGFMCAVCWSPLFVGMAIALSLSPGATWLDVAPIGMATAAIVLATAFVLDRFGPSDANPAVVSPAHRPSFGIGVPMVRILALFAALAGGVVVCHEGLAISIPIAIGLVGPPLAFAWRFASVAGVGGGTRPFLRETAAIPGSLGNETVLFLGANIFGIGAAAALDPATVAAAVAMAPDSVFMRSALLIVSGILSSAIGLHPVVFMVLVGQAFTPEMLGMTPSFFAGVLVIVWGVGIGVSPFSATIMQVARFANLSSYRIAWRMNAVFVSVVTLLTIVILNAVWA